MSADSTNSPLHLARAFVRHASSPERGLVGELLRFALSGGSVALVYVGVTTLLHDVFAVPFQIALVSGFLVGVSLHFTLQRVFVWRHRQGFALGAHHQAVRYLVVCFTQYGITAVSTSQLPDLLGLPVEVVYIVTALALAGVNFVVFRGIVFRADASCDEEIASQVHVTA